MTMRPKTFRARPVETRQQQAKRHDERRGSARERGYTGAWDKARAGYLRSHPLCAYCELDGVVTPATLVDHLYPHRTFEGVFWVKEWWVASCRACHDGPKQAAERAGRLAIDALARRLGRPLLT